MREVTRSEGKLGRGPETKGRGGGEVAATVRGGGGASRHGRRCRVMDEQRTEAHHSADESAGRRTGRGRPREGRGVGWGPEAEAA